MWPPHTNSRVPEREQRRLRVWLAASMIAMVDALAGDGHGWLGPPDATQCKMVRAALGVGRAGACRDGRRKPGCSVPAQT